MSAFIVVKTERDGVVPAQVAFGTFASRELAEAFVCTEVFLGTSEDDVEIVFLSDAEPTDRVEAR